MCLIVFAYKVHPKYSLILAGNRDEFYNRPTEYLHFWQNSHPIYAGKDLRGGGTWLGVNQSGRVAFLTNFRHSKSGEISTGKSRGELVLEVLTKRDISNINFSEYDDFNLVFGDMEGLWVVTHKDQVPKPLKPGLFALSNGTLESNWPKQVRARELFQQAVFNESMNQDFVFEMLKDVKQPPPDTLPNTGVPWEWECQLAPIFIQTPQYGTRASTFLSVSNAGDVQMIEKSWRLNGILDKTTELKFRIESSQGRSLKDSLNHNDF